MRARTIAGLLVVIAVGIVCVGYAPTNLGGKTTYVSTYGTSMQPRFHAGDLAVVKAARDYRVGDVAAYRSSTLDDAVVLHRIVAINDGRYTFKGDNNDFLDPSRPTADQIVGRLRFRIAHGGTIRGFIARPYILYPLLALVIGGAASGFFVRKRRRHSGAYDRQPARPSARGPGRLNPADGRRLRVVVPIAAAVTALAFLIAAVAAFGSPRSEQTTRRETYARAPHGRLPREGRGRRRVSRRQGRSRRADLHPARSQRRHRARLRPARRHHAAPRPRHLPGDGKPLERERLVAVDPAHPEPRVLGNPFRRPRAAASRRVARPRAALLRRDGTAVQPGDDQHRAARAGIRRARGNVVLGRREVEARVPTLAQRHDAGLHRRRCRCRQARRLGDRGRDAPRRRHALEAHRSCGKCTGRGSS